jgi:hypothetical protein
VRREYPVRGLVSAPFDHLLLDPSSARRTLTVDMPFFRPTVPNAFDWVRTWTRDGRVVIPAPLTLTPTADASREPMICVSVAALHRLASTVGDVARRVR